MSVNVMVRLDDRSIPVDITSHTIVLDLKQIISQEEQLQWELLDVYYEGEVLSNESILSSVLTGGGSELVLELSRKGIALRNIGIQNPTSYDFYNNLGSSNLIEDYITIGYDINEIFPQGGTPLHVSIELKYDVSVDVILSMKNVNPNIQDTLNSFTPLALACSDGNITAVRQLSQRSDIDVNIQDRNGSTPLLLASKNGYKEIVEILLSRSDVDVNISDSTGFPPLMFACIHGDIALVSVLLNHPTININICNAYGRNCLFNACVEGQEEVAEMLLNSPSVDLSTVDFDGQTLLHAVCREGHCSILQLLLLNLRVGSMLETDTLIKLLSINDHHFYLKCLSDLDNTTTIQHYTSLLSISSTHLYLRCLLEVNSDVSSNDNSTSPLQLLEIKNRHTHLRLLQESVLLLNSCSSLVVISESTNTESDQCEEELCYSNMEGSMTNSMVYSDPCGVSDETNSLLETCSGDSSVGRVCKMDFTRSVLNINSTDRNGVTPLHTACSEGHTAIVEMLLTYPGIDVNKSSPIFVLLN